MFKESSTFDVRDVTMHADDDLCMHRDKLARIVLDEMYQFVGLLDAKGTTLEINRAALEGAGIRIEDIRGKPFWDAHWWATSKETREMQRDMVLRASAGEFVRCDVEIYGQAAGEETIIVDYSLRPIKDKNGKVVFLLPEGRNITEKKRVEAEIARKNEELQRLLEQIRHLNQVKSDFFANVSHELRTPLTLILGPLTSILSSADNLTELQQRDLAVIQRNASTLAKHVNDLLDLAKLDAAKATLGYARIDLAQAVRQVAAHFDALAPQRSLSYVVSTPEALQADVDPEKFDRVLLNLLSNAFKFTPDGGRIRCSLAFAGTQRLLLSVQDSGPGIKPEMRSTIFERFRQGEGGTTRAFGGTGLGLAIAKEFVELHGGTITVSEAPGGGALFQVEMPLAAPEGAYVRRIETPAPAMHVGGDIDAAVNELQGIEPDVKERIVPVDRPLVLVAEDNAEMRRFIADVLGSDYRVVPVADGSEALARALAEPPDLVVMDLMMPKLGGDRLVDAMRLHPTLANVPVLVLSAMANEELRLKLLSELVQDYVTKPFSAHELRIRVSNLVIVKRAREALQKELATQNEDLAQLTEQFIASRQELQASHEALQESESRWRAVYENSAVGIVLTDVDGIIIEANPACQRMLGYAGAEMRGLSLMEITSESDREATRFHIDQLVSGSVPEYRQQKSYERKDGSFVWANASVSLIPGSENMAPMLVGIVEDITERKCAEAALAQTQVELARVARVTTMGELAASIAHEVNQPLAAIVTNGHASLRWLAAQPPNVKEANDALQHVIRDANRAGDVIARIRGFIKRYEPQRAEAQMADIIADVVSLVQNEASSLDIELVTETSPHLPTVAIDRVQVQQVILNLLMNAIEAMMQVRDRPRTLEVRAGQHGPDAIVVSVSDAGPGLDPQYQGTIFDAFYTTKPTGMGMGLTISRSIIESHGGRLWVTPNEGPGATFRFTLPVIKREQQ
ncbi:MAG TPA: ATP-binding protein [Noviherbaspirillum sp.]|nr:ATP-binding protein [Noviherbaspirillum sp.]